MLRPADAQVLCASGLAELGRGDGAAAMELLEHAADTPPFRDHGHATTLAALGKAYIGGGRHTEARDALARAKQLRADDAGLLYNLGSAHFRCGERERAKAALEGAQAARPGHARATALLEKMAAPTKARKKAS